MGIFNKDKAEKPDPKANALVEDTSRNATKNTETSKKGLTPEQKREAGAAVLQLVLYKDGNLAIKPIRNLDSRAMAEYIVSRAKDDYFKADVANLAAMRVMDLIIQSTNKKKKGAGLWTPGAK